MTATPLEPEALDEDQPIDPLAGDGLYVDAPEVMEEII
jgi:hypothetical protein